MQSSAERPDQPYIMMSVESESSGQAGSPKTNKSPSAAGHWTSAPSDVCLKYQMFYSTVGLEFDLDNLMSSQSLYEVFDEFDII